MFEKVDTGEACLLKAMFKKVHKREDLHHLPLKVTEELPAVLPAAAKPAAASAAGGHLQPPQKKHHHQFSFHNKARHHGRGY